MPDLIVTMNWQRIITIQDNIQKDMAHIKKVNEMFDNRYWDDVVRMRLPFGFSKNDKGNLTKIAMLLDALSTKWSNFVEDNEEMMDSDTDAIVRQLSLVAKKLNGEWDEQICF